MGSDEQLMLEYQQGSVEAFTELFERYREPMYGYFRLRLDDAARPEELARIRKRLRVWTGNARRSSIA